MTRVEVRLIASESSGRPPRVILAPARASRVRASSNPRAGRSRRSSSATVSSTIRRAPDRLVPSRSGARRFSMAAKRWAQSSTERAKGPTVSKVSHKGTTPVSGRRPVVVFRPTRSFQAAGIRTEPPVSDPIPAGASPKATEAAAPEEDPPDTAFSSLIQGLVAVIGLSPSPEKASSDIWVLPRQTSPSRVAAVNTAASACGTRPFKRAEPASVSTPAVSNRSFQLIGTPSSNTLRCPVLAREAAPIASPRARAGVVRA